MQYMYDPTGNQSGLCWLSILKPSAPSTYKPFKNITTIVSQAKHPLLGKRGPCVPNLQGSM